MSEFLDITGKILGVLGSLGTLALTGIKLCREVRKNRPEENRDQNDGDVDGGRRPAPDPGGQHQSSGRPWFVWGLVAAIAALLLGLAMLVLGSRLGKTVAHEVVEKPDAQKVQQARERLQFREGAPISAKNFHRGMWDLMYSGIIESEYGGKVILVAGPVGSVSDSLHTVDLEAGAFPATVTCSFGVRDRDRIKALRKGQTITVRGEIRTYRNGSGGEVAQLADCELVSRAERKPTRSAPDDRAD